MAAGAGVGGAVGDAERLLALRVLDEPPGGVDVGVVEQPVLMEDAPLEQLVVGDTVELDCGGVPGQDIFGVDDAEPVQQLLVAVVQEVGDELSDERDRRFLGVDVDLGADALMSLGDGDARPQRQNLRLRLRGAERRRVEETMSQVWNCSSSGDHSLGAGSSDIPYEIHWS